MWDSCRILDLWWDCFSVKPFLSVTQILWRDQNAITSRALRTCFVSWCVQSLISTCTRAHTHTHTHTHSIYTDSIYTQTLFVHGEPHGQRSLVGYGPWRSQRIRYYWATNTSLSYIYMLLFSNSVVSDCFWPHGLQHTRISCPSPSPRAGSNSCSLSHWCHPTISSSVFPIFSCLQSFLASGSFPESALHIRWPKYWSFSISLYNKYSGLISFRINWFDLLVIQGTLKSLVQYHSSKASVLWHSAFFMVQLSHPYMAAGKTIALTVWTFVEKLMTLLLNMLSRLVIAFLPRSKCLFISWLQSPSSVILEPKKIKSVTVSIVFPSICHEVVRPDAMIFVFECWVLSQLFHSTLSIKYFRQIWFPLGLTVLIFLQSKGLSRIFSYITVQKHQFLSAQLSLYLWLWLEGKKKSWCSCLV